MAKTIKEQSRIDWTPTKTVDNPDCKADIDLLQIGCLQRIADATEVMANNYTQMVNTLAHYRERVAEQSKEIERLGRVISGLCGYQKRLRNNTTKK